MSWKIGSLDKDKCRKFSVKSFYDALEPRVLAPFPVCIIWSSYVPNKMGFYV